MEEINPPIQTTPQQTPPVESVETTQPVPEPSGKKTINPLLIALAVVLFLVAGASAYYFRTKNQKVAVTSPPPTTVVNNTQTPSETNDTSVVSERSLFTGDFKRLDQNLKIFKLNEGDLLNEFPNDFVYYSSGVFNKGELQGYTRIIAIRSSGGPAPPFVHILATKDFESYYLHDPENLTTKYKEDEWNNPYNNLDKSKIIGTKTFDSEQPMEIKLDDKFSLYFDDFPTEYEKTGKKDAHDQPISVAVITTDFPEYKQLTSPQDNLTLYFQPYKANEHMLNHSDESERQKEKTRQQYYLGMTQVIVVDSVGLPMKYLLTTPESVATYNKDKAQYDVAWNQYQDLIKKFEAKEIAESPQYPDPVYIPGMGFKSSLIQDKTSDNFYKQYQVAIPGGCAFSLASRVMDISKFDLELVGKVRNQSVYKLSDPNHALYKLAYENKTSFADQMPEFWDQVNEGVSKPSYEEYVAINPLLFVKDYWDRWIGLGEYDLNLPGGCGKPVIYLYPPQPTSVEVRFINPVQLTTDVPKYNNSWLVKAFPNGNLQDLQPKFTQCEEINTNQKGLEYAKTACENNSYPYLFWAGNVTTQNYPIIDEGWIVKRGEVAGFLNSKLTKMGLNTSEKRDFMDYWVDEITKNDAPYYKISFLQTQDLNSLFPMVVTPQPDTIFRIFVDHQPLDSKPSVLPQPQELNILVRKGFTLVEWGGLKNF